MNCRRSRSLSPPVILLVSYKSTKSRPSVAFRTSQSHFHLCDLRRRHRNWKRRLECRRKRRLCQLRINNSSPADTSGTELSLSRTRSAQQPCVTVRDNNDANGALKYLHHFMFVAFCASLVSALSRGNKEAHRS